MLTAAEVQPSTFALAVWRHGKIPLASSDDACVSSNVGSDCVSAVWTTLAAAHTLRRQLAGRRSARALFAHTTADPNSDVEAELEAVAMWQHDGAMCLTSVGKPIMGRRV